MTGYQLIAIDSTGQAIATYAEAQDWMAALDRCVEEFPINEGYTGHYAGNDDGTTCKYSNDPDVVQSDYIETRLREMLDPEFISELEQRKSDDLPGLPLD